MDAIFKLRDYQQAAVDAGYKYLMKKNPRPGVIVAPTGCGKSLIISYLAKELNAPVLILQPSKEILLQNYAKAVAFGAHPTIYSASCDKKDLSEMTYATIGSIKKRVDDLARMGLKYVLVDECFTGDTEILTEKGFIKFSELGEDIKVAQYDEHNNKISFVKPIRHIKKEFHGELINIKIYRDVWMPVTDNHDMLIWDGRNRCYKKIKAKDMKFGNGISVPSCGESNISDSKKLTYMERLYIATQADGSIHTIASDHVTVAFSFSKNRKIERLHKLCSLANVSIREVKCPRTTERQSVKKKRRFMVDMPVGTTKDIRNHIKFPMSCEKAKEIVEELSLWDGSRIKDHLYYYSSIMESQADFYQSVAVIAGYSCYKTLQVDNRKDTFNDVYRLFIDKNKKRYGTQGYKKRKMEYDGYVYCVEVDAGNIVVRHNGVPLVTGNCHSGYSAEEGSEFMKFIGALPGVKVLGFTATPCRLHSYGSLVEGNYSSLNMLMYDDPSFFKEMVHVIQIEEMVKRGYWAKLRYEVWDFDESDLMLNGNGSEYTTESIARSIITNGVNNTIYKRLNMLWNERKHILVCMDSVENCNIISEFINKKRGAVVTGVVSAETPKKKREQILEDFKSGKLKAVFNYSTLATGFDFPELDCVMFGRPTFSFAIYYQFFGRVVRPHKDKPEGFIIDCCNNFRRFGPIEKVSIEHIPYKGWCMFSDEKLISCRMDRDIYKSQLLEYAEKRKRATEEAKHKPKEEGWIRAGAKDPTIQPPPGQKMIKDSNMLMWFGKYKGTPLEQVPLDYLKWVSENLGDSANIVRVKEYYFKIKGLQPA